MVYRFTGRIKKIGIDGSKKKFCEFDVDNSVRIDGEDYGVSYSITKGTKDENVVKFIDLHIVEKFTNIGHFYSVLLECHDERFEIEYTIENGAYKLTKVTVLK